jgi:hypothetical protein
LVRGKGAAALQIRAAHRSRNIFPAAGPLHQLRRFSLTLA